MTETPDPATPRPATDETEYANTDFDLTSDRSFDALHRELAAACYVLHYTPCEDGRWRAIVEASLPVDPSLPRSAARDILQMLEAIRNLTPTAREELDACSQREFNLGFECRETWAYVHSLPAHVVRAVADAGCSLAVTLYPLSGR